MLVSPELQTSGPENAFVHGANLTVNIRDLENLEDLIRQGQIDFQKTLRIGKGNHQGTPRLELQKNIRLLICALSAVVVLFATLAREDAGDNQDGDEDAHKAFAGNKAACSRDIYVLRDFRFSSHEQLSDQPSHENRNGIAGRKHHGYPESQRRRHPCLHFLGRKFFGKRQHNPQRGC